MGNGKEDFTNIPWINLKTNRKIDSLSIQVAKKRAMLIITPQHLINIPQ